jgi:hypothetical protein
VMLMVVLFSGMSKLYRMIITKTRDDVGRDN